MRWSQLVPRPQSRCPLPAPGGSPLGSGCGLSITPIRRASRHFQIFLVTWPLMQNYFSQLLLSSSGDLKPASCLLVLTVSFPVQLRAWSLSGHMTRPRNRFSFRESGVFYRDHEVLTNQVMKHYPPLETSSRSSGNLDLNPHSDRQSGWLANRFQRHQREPTPSWQPFGLAAFDRLRRAILPCNKMRFCT